MSTILTENFNSYTDGDLNGQGSWAGDTDFDIQGVTVMEGAKALQYVNIADKGISKTGDLVATGRISLYIRRTGTVGFGLGSIILQESGSSMVLMQVDEATVQYFDGADFVTVGTITANNWFIWEIEWRISDKKARYRSWQVGEAEGEWTDWDTTWGTFTNGLDGVKIYTYSSGCTTFIDHIGEYPIQLSEVANVAFASISETANVAIANISTVSKISI